MTWYRSIVTIKGILICFSTRHDPDLKLWLHWILTIKKVDLPWGLEAPMVFKNLHELVETGWHLLD